MKKKILGLLIALGLSIPAYASITVSPTRIEIDANKIKNNYTTTAIEVKGENDRAVRYRAYTGYFKVKNNELDIINNSNGDPYDISKKVRFVPSEFTVPPGKSQKVRVNIAGINTLQEGESRAIIFLEDIEAKEVNLPNPGGIGAQLVLKTRVGIPVYVDKGKFTKKGEIEAVEFVKEKNSLYTKVKVNSIGTNKIRCNGKVQVIQNKKLIDEYSLNGFVIQGGGCYVAKDKFKSTKIKDAGDYTVRVILSYADENGSKKNIKKDAILQIKGEI